MDGITSGNLLQRLAILDIARINPELRCIYHDLHAPEFISLRYLERRPGTKVYQELATRKGRFTRADLVKLAWHEKDYDKAQQELAEA